MIVDWMMWKLCLSGLDDGLIIISMRWRWYLCSSDYSIGIEASRLMRLLSIIF